VALVNRRRDAAPGRCTCYKVSKCCGCVGDCVTRVRDLWRVAAGAMSLAGAIVVGGCITDNTSPDAQVGLPGIAVPAAPQNAVVQGDPSDGAPPQSFEPDTQEGVPPITTPTIRQNADAQYYPSDEPLRLGIEYFNRGNFGLAERYFRDAVEKAPRDASAWIGLAASYDRLGRFDLADRAYQSATRLVGDTTAILNNRGYSYMLRGDLNAAHRYFLRAYKREPSNPTIINNLKLLDASRRFIERSPGAL
jgi:tetratricopeptide (TPR) repeat protein